MLYVSRDLKGNINGISDRAAPHAREYLPKDHPDVAAYLERLNPNTVQETLSETDLEMGRITEDLIDVLISKNIINFTDLPPQAQKKLVARQRLRHSLSALSSLVGRQDDIV